MKIEKIKEGTFDKYAADIKSDPRKRAKLERKLNELIDYINEKEEPEYSEEEIKHGRETFEKFCDLEDNTKKKWTLAEIKEMLGIDSNSQSKENDKN